MSHLDSDPTGPAITESTIPPIVRECTALRDLNDWANTLLCNAAPPPHSNPAEWEMLVSQWRQRHAEIAYQPKLGETPHP